MDWGTDLKLRLPSLGVWRFLFHFHYFERSFNDSGDS